MSTENPIIYTFPRDRDPKTEPSTREPRSEGLTEDGVWPVNPLTQSSIATTISNINGFPGNTPSGRKQVPELVLIVSQPLQIWFDGEQLVESPDRRVREGKYYLQTVGEVELMKIADVKQRSVDEAPFDVPEHIRQSVSRPADRIEIEICYGLTQETEPYPGASGGPRHLFESTNTPDPPPIPFEPVGDVLEREQTPTLKNRRLSEFE